MYFYRYLGERLEDSATRAGVRAIEDRAARGRRLQTITYDEALRDKIIVGTPEQVTDRLMGLKEELGLDGILARDELRHQDPAPAGHEVAAAALRKGEAAVPLKPSSVSLRSPPSPAMREREGSSPAGLGG